MRNILRQGSLRLRFVFVVANMALQACAIPPDDTDGTLGAADGFSTAGSFFSQSRLQHGPMILPDGSIPGDARVNMPDGGMGMANSGVTTLLPAPRQILIDFVDVTGYAVDRFGDTEFTGRLKGPGRAPTTATLAQTLIDEMNRHLQAPSPGLLPQLAVGSIRVQGVDDLVPTRNYYAHVARVNRFTFLVINSAQHTIDGAPSTSCGYASPDQTRSVVLVESCVRQFAAIDWAEAVNPQSFRFLVEVLTHEFGHWLTLPHNFGYYYPDQIPTDCSDLDGVSDTAPLLRSGLELYSCDPLPARECRGYDQLQHPNLNIMGYAHACNGERGYGFTLGQVQRMNAAWTGAYGYYGFQP